MGRRHLRYGSLIVLVLALSACALNSEKRHQAVVGSTTIAESLFALQDAEEVLFKAGQLTPEQHQRFNAKLVPLLETGQSLNRVITSWPTGEPAPPELRALVTSLRALSEDVLTMLPDSPAKAAITSKLLLVQESAITVLLLLAS